MNRKVLGLCLGVLGVVLAQPVALADEREGHEAGDYRHSKQESSEYGHSKREYGDSGHGKRDYGQYEHSRGYGRHGMGMRMGFHGSTTHLIHHMLKHEKNIGLKEDQVSKLRELQLTLDKARIKTEADIMIAERELQALVEDEKSELSVIESKIKQSEELEASLRVTAVKARREALGLLSPEQRQKVKSDHREMTPEHKVPPRGSHGEMRGHPPMGGGHSPEGR